LMRLNRILRVSYGMEMLGVREVYDQRTLLTIRLLYIRAKN
jgi:hypothetical protein